MIFLALGSNLSSKYGDRFTNINTTISLLELNKIKVLNKSSFYETPSYPDNSKPKFINVVIGVSSELSPENFASVLINTEEKFGRKRINKNDPRSCDIDIIDYNGQIINFSCGKLKFIVPHKKMASRNFVLYPLEEIAPNWVHPKTKAKICSLINSLADENRKSILKIAKN